MKFTQLVFMAAAVQAIPFKRYDNGTVTTTTPVTALPSSSEADVTSTIDEYVTITLPSTTVTLPTASSSAIQSALVEASSYDATLTSTIVEYVTLTSGSSTITSATNTLTSTIAPTQSAGNGTTTSTITNVVTVTSDDRTLLSTQTSAVTEAVSDQCVPTTVTVTVTASASSSDDQDVTSTITSFETLTNLFPITAELTYSDFTTTITSDVYVTSTLTHTTATVYPASATAEAKAVNATIPVSSGYTNGTIHSATPTASYYSFESAAPTNAKRFFWL